MNEATKTKPTEAFDRALLDGDYVQKSSLIRIGVKLGEKRDWARLTQIELRNILLAHSDAELFAATEAAVLDDGDAFVRKDFTT